jgi:hypothetical protein
MQGIAVKVGFVALLGTTMVGAIYSEMVRPRLERSVMTVAPKQEFQWTWVPPPTSPGVSVVQPSAARPAAALAAPQLQEPSPAAFAAGGSEVLAATDGFFLPAQFVVPAASGEAARTEAPPATAAMASLETPIGPEETWASPGPGPEHVFAAALAEPPLSPAVVAGAPAPERKPETPAGADARENGAANEQGPASDLAADITVAPEPAALALLASGLVLLGLAGFAQQWRRGG